MRSTASRGRAWRRSRRCSPAARKSRRGTQRKRRGPRRRPGRDDRRISTRPTCRQFDSLVVTPGLPLNRHPIAQRARDAGVEIIGDIELFARARPELPPHKVVGITGTNGKSTTTALVHHILKTAGVPTTMGGNIGLPILAQDPLPEGGVYVLELSSYQIDLTQSLDCDVAVLLNITPDHLDRYESFEAYAASKARLFQIKTPEHLGVIEDATELRFGIGSGATSPLLIFEAKYPLEGQGNWPALQGPSQRTKRRSGMDRTASVFDWTACPIDRQGAEMPLSDQITQVLVVGAGPAGWRPRSRSAARASRRWWSRSARAPRCRARPARAPRQWS